jgi:hypothetical protein
MSLYDYLIILAGVSIPVALYLLSRRIIESLNDE